MAALSRRPTTGVCPNALLVGSGGTSTPFTTEPVHPCPVGSPTSPRCSQVLHHLSKNSDSPGTCWPRVRLNSIQNCGPHPPRPQSTPTSGRKLQREGGGWGGLPLPPSPPLPQAPEIWGEGRGGGGERSGGAAKPSRTCCPERVWGCSLRLAWAPSGILWKTPWGLGDLTCSSLSVGEGSHGKLLLQS